MKKLLFNLRALMLLLLMMVGVSSVWAEEGNVFYTLSAVKSTKNTAYANSYDITFPANEGLTWNVPGNQNFDGFWRIGGKSLSNTARTITGKSAINSIIGKVTLNHKGVSNTNLTINSIALTVASAEDFATNNIIETKTIIAPSVSSSGSIDFEPVGNDWPKNSYYKLTIVCTNDNNSNYGLDFLSLVFYEGALNDNSDDTRTAVNMTGFSATSTTLVKGDNTTTSVTNDQNGWTPSYTYESSNTGVATVSNDGVITAVTKGTATITASLNIANDDATWKKGATASKTIDITVNNPSHTAKFSINGSINEDDNKTVEEGDAIVFPTDPEVDGVVFKGWTTAAIVGTQDNAPEFVNTETVTMGENDVTYYAVFATEEKDGSQWKKVAASAVNSAGVYAIITTDGHAFNGTISSGHGQLTNTAFSFNANGIATSAPDGTCEITFAAVTGGYTMYNAGNGYLYASAASSGKLAWHNTESSYWLYKSSNWLYNSNSAYLRDYQNSSIRTYGANNGSVIQFAKKEIRLTYSDYCTTVSLDTKPTIVLSATELAEYAGNTNTSITAFVSEDGYTGTLTVASSAEAVATASISEGTITIQAHTAGTATITVTALAMTGFRQNTATIAVTVSEKLAHGLSFSDDALELTVGDTEFTEPTLSNPNSLSVVYSLVYSTPANAGKVATINAETGKLTLADPSLSTETQGAVMVKASTDGDNSHAAGEVTYNLVVARKSSTTSWSNGGTAVTIDKDEIETLPTATNSADCNIQYESSNTKVATIDNNGAVTFANYGTTTITAKTSETAEYAATSATYELTFAPRYTVTFIINGNETVLREETTGAGVTAPVVDPISGKVFCGWVEDEINGTTNDKPDFVSTESLDGDKTLYAVFATASGNFADVNITMNALSITKEGVTITCAKGDGQSAPAWTSTEFRVYASNTITISASSNITAFSLTFHKQGSKEYISSMTADTGTYTSGGASTSGEDDKIDTWSGSAESITLTAGVPGQRVLVGGTVTVGEKSYSDYCTNVESFSATIAECGYTTVCLPYNAKIVEDGAQAYALSKITSDGALNLEAVDVMNAGDGYVVAGTAGSTYTLTATASTNDKTNLLQGVVDRTAVSTLRLNGSDNFAYPWILAKDGSFKKYTGVNIPANKAYLDGGFVEDYVNKTNASSATLRVVFEESEQTGLETMTKMGKGENFVYDLTGKKVPSINKSGLYIVNGKKVVIK